jgi:hypothetical protein
MQQNKGWLIGVIRLVLEEQEVGGPISQPKT